MVTWRIQFRVGEAGNRLPFSFNIDLFQMGQNPMQTGGCWAICAAILKNPSCVMKLIDFTVSCAEIMLEYKKSIK